jgi:hypothetical protein
MSKRCLSVVVFTALQAERYGLWVVPLRNPAAAPVDEGTWKVICEGTRILFDRQDYLATAISG